MTRYVVLATDSAPTYAVWAPVAARLWRRCGYTPILLVEDGPAWREPAQAVIYDAMIEGAHLGAWIPRTGELTIANTMRCARLVAAAVPGLEPSDFILTSDVDMIPLAPAFFQRTEPFLVLRAMFNVWLATKVIVNNRPNIDLTHVWAGNFRFPLCYSGASVEIWREMVPEILVGDPAASLAQLVAGTGAWPAHPDAVDLDERLASFRFLDSPRAAGEVIETDPAGVWRKGELVLVDPLDLPLISEYDNMPRAMLRLDDFWTPVSGTPAPPEAIDYIPFRFYPGTKPWRCLDVIAAYWPDEAAWLQAYRARVDPLLP